MKKQIVELNEIKLVGVKVLTNNNDEQSHDKAKISKTIKYFFNNKLPEKIVLTSKIELCKFFTDKL